MKNKITFGNKVLQFNNDYLSKINIKLPKGFKMINPFNGANKEQIREITKKFYSKYYNDNNPRKLIIGSSPARRGTAVTGIPYEDAKHLQDTTGISIDNFYVNKSSSNFLYDVIENYGGSEKFYSNFYMNFVCPIGIIRINSRGNEVNCNYYENKKVQELLYSFILESIKKQIEFGLDTSVAYCIGSGENYIFLTKLNEKYKLFEKIIALEHPRFIMQYNLKNKDEFMKKYLDALNIGEKNEINNNIDTKILVHFNTNNTKVYELKNGVINLLYEEQIFFNETLVHNEMFKKFDIFFKKLDNIVNGLDNKKVKLYATGIFQELSKEEQMQLIINIFVNSNIYLNIIDRELEKFYLEKSKKVNNSENIINGIVNQEFRKVVICGSFQQNMKEISDLIDKFNKYGIEVLSPWTTNVVPETLDTDFILLEGQELVNERDAWRHKYDHMNKFKKADAIVVCNPNGIVGKGTMFEFGFMIAHYKRIIFTEEPTNISIIFPYEVGLNF